MKKYLAAAAVVVALATGVGVYLGSGATAAPASTFVLLDGSQKSTADLKGKVTLVNSVSYTHLTLPTILRV